jgi:hypothetical protein
MVRRRTVAETIDPRNTPDAKINNHRDSEGSTESSFIQLWTPIATKAATHASTIVRTNCNPLSSKGCLYCERKKGREGVGLDDCVDRLYVVQALGFDLL